MQSASRREPVRPRPPNRRSGAVWIEAGAGDDVEAIALDRRPLSFTAWCDSVRQSERGSQIVLSLT